MSHVRNVNADGTAALERMMLQHGGEILRRLRLSAAEAARACNVTPRQLIYWSRKGLLGPAGDGERDFDAQAMEKAIRIRLGLEQGQSLEKAAQTAERELSLHSAEVARLSAMEGDDLEEELRRRLERLEQRISALRTTLPPALTLSRLRTAVAFLSRLETNGMLPLNGTDGEAAKTFALRLDGAVKELETLLTEVGTAST